MAKYVAVYKCPLCEMILTAAPPAEVPYDMLPELLAAVIKQQKFMGSPLCPAPMHIPHKCENGSAGLAYFAGFAKVV